MKRDNRIFARINPNRVGNCDLRWRITSKIPKSFKIKIIPL